MIVLRMLVGIYCLLVSSSCRNIKEVDHSSLPSTAKECLNFLRSEPFCLLLAHLTGLDLVKDFRHLFPQLVTRYAEKGMSSDEPIELLSSDEEGEKPKNKTKRGKKQNEKEAAESFEKQATIKMITTKQGTEDVRHITLIDQSIV